MCILKKAGLGWLLDVWSIHVQLVQHFHKKKYRISSEDLGFKSIQFDSDGTNNASQWSQKYKTIEFQICKDWSNRKSVMVNNQEGEFSMEVINLEADG